MVRLKLISMSNIFTFISILLYIGSRSLRFMIHGIPICKYYFRLCIGFSENHFNDTLYKQFNPLARRTKHKKLLTADKVRYTLGILDVLFKRQSIKFDPSVKNYLVHVKSRWVNIYKEDFVPLWTFPCM